MRFAWVNHMERLIRCAEQLSRTIAFAVISVGPAVGEHNAEIYGRLGIDAEQLATLRSEGMV